MPTLKKKKKNHFIKFMNKLPGFDLKSKNLCSELSDLSDQELELIEKLNGNFEEFYYELFPLIEQNQNLMHLVKIEWIDYLVINLVNFDMPNRFEAIGLIKNLIRFHENLTIQTEMNSYFKSIPIWDIIDPIIVKDDPTFLFSILEMAALIITNVERQIDFLIPELNIFCNTMSLLYTQWIEENEVPLLVFGKFLFSKNIIENSSDLYLDIIEFMVLVMNEYPNKFIDNEEWIHILMLIYEVISLAPNDNQVDFYNKCIEQIHKDILIFNEEEHDRIHEIHIISSINFLQNIIKEDQVFFKFSNEIPLDYLIFISEKIHSKKIIWDLFIKIAELENEIFNIIGIERIVNMFIFSTFTEKCSMIFTLIEILGHFEAKDLIENLDFIIENLSDSLIVMLENCIISPVINIMIYLKNIILDFTNGEMDVALEFKKAGIIDGIGDLLYEGEIDYGYYKMILEYIF